MSRYVTSVDAISRAGAEACSTTVAHEIVCDPLGPQAAW